MTQVRNKVKQYFISMQSTLAVGKDKYLPVYIQIPWITISVHIQITKIEMLDLRVFIYDTYKKINYARPRVCAKGDWGAFQKHLWALKSKSS